MKYFFKMTIFTVTYITLNKIGNPTVIHKFFQEEHKALDFVNAKRDYKIYDYSGTRITLAKIADPIYIYTLSYHSKKCRGHRNLFSNEDLNREIENFIKKGYKIESDRCDDKEMGIARAVRLNCFDN